MDQTPPAAPDVPPRVEFGHGETDSMPVEWASRALIWLKQKEPQTFARMMTEGVFGIERRRRNGSQP